MQNQIKINTRIYNHPKRWMSSSDISDSVEVDTGKTDDFSFEDLQPTVRLFRKNLLGHILHTATEILLSKNN